VNAHRNKNSSSDEFLATENDALKILGRKTESRRRALDALSGVLVLLSLAAASFFVVRLLTKQYQVNFDADNFAVVGLTLICLIFARLLVTAGKLLNSGLSRAVADIADRMVAAATANRVKAASRISKRMKGAAESHRFEIQRGVSDLVILSIVSTAFLVAGKIAIDQEWVRFVVTMGAAEQRFALMLAGAFAVTLLLWGRRDSLSQEEAFHKKIMGYVYGAIDDENLSGVGGPALARALQAIDSRHRRSAAARLSYDAVRKRLGI
jgi:hypothetical protein